MPTVLAINGGSSSIRFALYSGGASTQKGLSGKIERIGLDHASFSVAEPSAPTVVQHDLPLTDTRAAVHFLIDWLDAHGLVSAVAAVGHRIVNGGPHADPELITPALLDELRRFRPLDPEHLPSEIGVIEAIGERRPELPQVACFDTAFHRSMPRVARILPIPRRYAARGVERYGFHGLSYAYLMGELSRIGDPAASRGRVILAHLGNGASLAAVRDGKSIDTTMGFTPTAGLVMSTRTGDLDPGLAYFFAVNDGMDAANIQTMVNHESGLLGISETSSDVRDLLARESGDVRAAEALQVFCYQTKKWIGAYAAALGGLDAIVFAGGIGENAAAIRARICGGLEFLGLELDEARNEAGAAMISADASRIRVRVIRTDEEQMIARQTRAVIDRGL